MRKEILRFFSNSATTYDVNNCRITIFNSYSHDPELPRKSSFPIFERFVEQQIKFGKHLIGKFFDNYCPNP